MWKYKEWDYVLVSTNNKIRNKRIFFREFTDLFWCIEEEDEQDYLAWRYFSTSSWNYIKPLDDIPKERKLLLTDEKREEVKEFLNINE